MVGFAMYGHTFTHTQTNMHAHTQTHAHTRTHTHTLKCTPGIKVWVRADSRNCYFHTLLVYTGREGSGEKTQGEMGADTCIVSARMSRSHDVNTAISRTGQTGRQIP